MKHTFQVDGDPVGKGRPRFTRQGRAYTPKRTKDYEAKVRQAYIDSGGPDFGERLMSMIITANFGMPSSWSKKKRAALDGKFCGKLPDADNCIKSVADALNGTAYADDKQIVVCTCSKHWSSAGSLEVEIEMIEKRVRENRNGN